jgi:hypothetical protein
VKGGVEEGVACFPCPNRVACKKCHLHLNSHQKLIDNAISAISTENNLNKKY